MSENFEAGLRDLHDDAALAHARGAGFPIASMTGRARRIRRIRTGGLSAVAAFAVVGLAWAGSAMAGLGGPIQPAQPSVTTEPPDTYTDTVEPDVYAGPACGSAIGEVPVFDEPPLVIEVTLERDVAGPADPLPGRVVLAVAGGLEITLDAEGVLEGLDYSAVRDGVVVGYGRSALIDGTWQTLSGRQGVTALATIQLQPCDTAASDLPAGDYELFASMPGTVAAGEGEEPDSRTILGGPWPFTIRESSGGTPEPDPTTPMPLLAPGDSRLVDGASRIPAAETSLEDGDYIGFLHGIDIEAGSIDFDIAIFYSGQAAIDWLAANDPIAENPPPNGYIIVNEVERVRSLPLAPGAVVWNWCYWSTGESDFLGRTAAEWTAAPEGGIAECDAGAGTPRDPFRLYWFDVRGGVVQQVVGQYVP
jgi:hypothetical protein